MHFVQLLSRQLNTDHCRSLSNWLHTIANVRNKKEKSSIEQSITLHQIMMYLESSVTLCLANLSAWSRHLPRGCNTVITELSLLITLFRQEVTLLSEYMYI